MGTGREKKWNLEVRYSEPAHASVDFELAQIVLVDVKHVR